MGEILDNKNEIVDLRKKIDYIENLLPTPHIVKSGENHYQIAMDYLLNKKGVEKEKALELVERTLLFDPVVPGFKIWNFYSNGEFGSIITQGLASISPNEISRKERKKITDERDFAVKQKNKFEKDLKYLYSKRKEIIEQISNLESEKNHLLKRVGELNRSNKEMMRRINSLYFICDKKTVLKKNGYLKGGFFRSLKMQSISSDQFEKSIDLRTGTSINISASDLNLSYIKRIRIYPKFFKLGSDYLIESKNNNRDALIKITKKERFKGERILISVE